MNANHPSTIYKMARIRAFLTGEPKSATAVHTELFMGKRCAERYMTFMHGLGEIHIASWSRVVHDHPYPIAQYALGAGKDAKKPAPMKREVIRARSRKKLRSDPDQYNLYLQRDRNRKRKIPKNALVNALFGRPA